MTRRRTTPCRRRARPLAARALATGAVLGALALASPAAAQGVRVRVVERETGAPVAGAIVSLLAGDGTRLAPGLTDADGRQELRAPAPGSYRVQVERVGFGTVVTLPVELARGAARDQTVLLTSRPTRLSGVRVVDRRRCAADPARNAATADLWAEARKALTARELTAARRLVPVELRGWRRELDGLLRVTSEAPPVVQTGMTERPYYTLPADELAARGYAREDPGGGVLFAPTAAVLLSPSFLGGHCFSAAGASGDARLVGLAFRPVRDRPDVVDVAGTLWLDAATSELRHLEFRYTNLPAAREAPAVGGRIEYERLPTGAWIERRWYIRSARLAARLTPAGRHDYVLLGYHEEGSEAVVRDRPPPPAAAPATLAGTVFDSTRGAAVAGALVLVAGPDGAVVRDSTDAAGRFARAVPPGRYSVRVDHPLFAHPAARAELAADAAPGGAVELLAFVPGATTLAAAACGASDPAASTGTLVGRARDAATGAPLAFATVVVRWSSAQPLAARPTEGPRVRVSARGQELRVTTDPGGRYLACGVPAGVPVSVGAPSDPAPAPALEVPRGGLAGRDVLVGAARSRPR